MLVSAYVPNVPAGVKGGAEVMLRKSFGKCDGGRRGVRNGREREANMGSGERTAPRGNLEPGDGTSGGNEVVG